MQVQILSPEAMLLISALCCLWESMKANGTLLGVIPNHLIVQTTEKLKETPPLLGPLKWEKVLHVNQS